MLGTSLMSKQQLKETDLNGCDNHLNGYKTGLTGGSNVKENKNSIQPQFCDGTNIRCDSSKRRLLAESELNGLLSATTAVKEPISQADAQGHEEPLTTTINGSTQSIELKTNSINQEHTNHARPILTTDSDFIRRYYQQKSWDQLKQNYSFPRRLHPEQFEPFVLQPSLFHRNKVPPTIYFNTKLNDESKPPVGLPWRLRPLFKWKISSISPNSIRHCVTFMRFEIVRPSNVDDTYYLGSWCKHMPAADFSSLEEWRKVNHYPGSFHMGRKDKLWLRLKLASHKFESFHPTTFVLPRDYTELDRYWRSSPNKLFIMKPPASARGNGIKVINDISQIPESAIPTSNDVISKKSAIIVQEYISNPCLLENGHKFDLRVYVLLTSVDPLRIYVYEEGLVRFASSKYQRQDNGIIDQYMHLTNYSVNKTNQKYQVNNDCESLHGYKWSLKRFWRYLNEHHKQIDTQRLWGEIIDIVIKTIISCESPMNNLSHHFCKNDYTSYELFGFDILLDENFKPWILEVNITPSLKAESNLDTSVKYPLIKDMFNLVGYHLPPPCPKIKAKLGSYLNQPWFYDPKLYQENLSKHDRIKHLKYQKIFKMVNVSNEVSPISCGASCTLAVGDGNQRYQQNVSSPSTTDGSSSDRSSQTVINNYNSSQDVAIQSNHANQAEQSSSGDEDSSASKNISEQLISRESILSDLSQSDVRVLMLAEDELPRCGQFRRVFPSADSSKYLKYFDKPRYYNLLLDAWEHKYRENRVEGVMRLSTLAKFLD